MIESKIDPNYKRQKTDFTPTATQQQEGDE